jgi:hypothetical protein
VCRTRSAPPKGAVSGPRSGVEDARGARGAKQRDFRLVELHAVLSGELYNLKKKNVNDRKERGPLMTGKRGGGTD